METYRCKPASKNITGNREWELLHGVLLNIGTYLYLRYSIWQYYLVMQFNIEEPCP
jgi:hypothetical protein